MGTNKNGQIRFLWVCNILWAIFVFVLCVMPVNNFSKPKYNIPHLDKVVHFGFYFIMAVMLYRLFALYGGLRTRIILYILAIVLIYSGTIELLQEYVFNRSGDFRDLLANLAGAFCGCLLSPFIFKTVLGKYFRTE